MDVYYYIEHLILRNPFTYVFIMLVVAQIVLWKVLKKRIKKDASSKLVNVKTYNKMNHIPKEEKPLRCKLGQHKFPLYGLYNTDGIKTCELCGLRLVRGSYAGISVPVEITRDGYGVK